MSTSPRLAAALAYASDGIPVFPCAPGTKTPATKRGFHDATTDLDIIRSWWDRADYNPAISPAEAGYAVVDLDPGANMADVDGEGPLPETYTVRTPRGGRHFYFAGELPPTVGKLGEHIDTRGRGSYVLLPGSVVDARSGKPADQWGEYRVELDIDVAELPAWIAAAATRRVEHAVALSEDLDQPWNLARAADMLRRRVAGGRVAIEGSSGDAETLRVANAVMDFGVSPDATLAMMLEHWNPACEPPWSEDELDAKVQNAFRYRQNEVGSAALEASPADIFAAAVARLPATQSDQPAAASRGRFHFEDEAEQDAAADPSWLLPGVIPDNEVIMLYGPTRNFKSFIALDIALAVAAQVPAFGVKPTRGGPVFYCAAEGRTGIKKARRHAWRMARGIEAPIPFYVGPTPHLTSDEELQAFGAALRERCGGVRPALLVLDTTAKVMAGLSEDKAQDAGRFTDWCDQLVAYLDCPVIAIHHSSDKEGAGRGARGSSAFKANVDTMIRVDRVKDTLAVEVWVEKFKDAEEPKHPFTFLGRAVAGSLVFDPTTAEQHRRAVKDDGEITREAVGHALLALGASMPRTVSSHVLADAIRPAAEDVSFDERGEQIAVTVKLLERKARQQLQAYCYRAGGQWQWALPSPDQA